MRGDEEHRAESDGMSLHSIALRFTRPPYTSL